MAAYGEGELGQIVSLGGYRLPLTWEGDMMLWLGRMLVGEPGTGGQTEWAALLWTYASLAALRRRNNFVSLVRAHSQPINPKWARDGEFCKLGGTHRNRVGQNPSNYYGLDPCSPDKLDRRDQISNLRWEEIPQDRRDFLVNWARGRVPNPVPRSVDFAAQSISPKDGLELVWSAPGTNAFYSNAASRQWDDGYVYISYNGQQSEETTPEELGVSSTPQVRNFDSSAISPSVSNEIFERNSTITVNRSAPPNQKYQYAVTPSDGEDPQAEIVLDENQEEQIVRITHERFYQQTMALKQTETLEIAGTVPTIKIWTQNENGEIVDLNELLFSKPVLHNYFENSFEFIQEIEFPERPIATIESFQCKVEPPSVGGVATITIGTLRIKVHNPSLATIDHPDGKYIAYMMRQGLFLRIRYGIEPPASNNIAFQWKEQDFIISQHNIVINDDKTYVMDITLIPASEKLFNQIHIGESIPFSDLGSNAITEQDIDNILQSITSPETPQEELNEMRRRMNNFRLRFNSGVPSVGYRTVRVENESGEATVGSVLHGAISQSQILQNPDGLVPIPIENMVDALRSIQSILLTRRIQNILERDAYRATIKGIRRNVIGLGPLVFNLALPEMEAVAAYISQNQIKLGESFSSDIIGLNDDSSSAMGHSSEEGNRRSNVKLIFGKFNGRAGQWANRPISAFPINVEAIFAHLRQERDVGQFSSTLNNFLSVINDIANEPANFAIERDPNGQGEPEYPIEIPQLKYHFYPDPTDSGSWVMYIYDAKVPFVRFRELTSILNSGEEVSKSEIIEKLQELRIPWIEMGESGSIIKQMSARTYADDLIAAHNMIMANRLSLNVRNMDGSQNLPPGISREFLDGAQLDPQNVIRQVTMIMPVEVSMVTHNLCTAVPFAPVYIFFPVKQLSALYVPQAVDHEVRSGMAQTRFVLQINITRTNRIPGN